MSQDTDESLSNKNGTIITESTTSTRKRHRDNNNIDELNQRKKRKLNENNQKTVEERYRDLFAQNLSLNDELSLCKREKDHYKERMDYYKEKYLNLQQKLMIFEEDEANNTKNEDDDIDSKQNKSKSYSNNTINMNSSQNKHKLTKPDKNANIVLSAQKHKDTMNTNKNEELSVSPSPHHSNNKNEQNNEIETEDTMTDYIQILPFLSPPASPYHHQSDQKNTSISVINSNINNNNQEIDKLHGKEIIPKLEKTDHSHSHTQQSSNNIKNIHIINSNNNNSNSCNTNCHSSSSYKEHTNDDNERAYISILDNTDWDHCHFVSVDCKFCGQHFDEYCQYIVHLKTHFDSDPSKKWKRCNENGCDIKKPYDETKFIRHLSTHGHQHPFHCKKKTLDGKICQFSASTRNGLVGHLKTSLHKIRVTWNTSTTRKKERNRKKIEMKRNEYFWEECHFVLVHCKFCGKQFNEYNDYVIHLEYHFDNDPKKIWLKCSESGCNSTKRFTQKRTFIEHLCCHSYPDPFHCNIKTLDGKICRYSTSTKYNMVRHLGTSIHFITIKKAEKIKKDKVEMDDDDDVESDDYDESDDDEEYIAISDNKKRVENDDNYVWEHCHFISADCKYCKQHFNDYDEYIEHLKNHFDNDPSKIWRKCDESWCDVKKIWKSTQSFISHLCSHGHPYPFHCKLKKMDGTLCKSSSANKGAMIAHLGSRKHNINLKSSK